MIIEITNGVAAAAALVAFSLLLGSAAWLEIFLRPGRNGGNAVQGYDIIEKEPAGTLFYQENNPVWAREHDVK